MDAPDDSCCAAPTTAEQRALLMLMERVGVLEERAHVVERRADALAGALAALRRQVTVERVSSRYAESQRRYAGAGWRLILCVQSSLLWSAPPFAPRTPDVAFVKVKEFRSAAPHDCPRCARVVEVAAAQGVPPAWEWPDQYWAQQLPRISSRGDHTTERVLAPLTDAEVEHFGLFEISVV